MQTSTVSFSPTSQEIGQIEQWLTDERNETGEGFLCNWRVIKSAFDENEIATILIDGEPVGFITWQIFSKRCAEIVIAEVKPSHRNRGLGKSLVNSLFEFFRKKNIVVVSLECSPESSEPIWRKLGFVDFPDTPEKYNLNPYGNKNLYRVLIPSLQTSQAGVGETIELWNDEPYIALSSSPNYIWNLEFKQGGRELVKPIVHPSHYDWRMRWSDNGKVIKDSKVKHFGSEIDFRRFIIISELPQISE